MIFALFYTHIYKLENINKIKTIQRRFKVQVHQQNNKAPWEMG
jgi:hypothetical protein